jgi:glutamyl-tRNA(Gln) amidotransferase subunit E
VSVEEDSCREVSDQGHRIVFRTDRLGMPLTETVTGAELRTPEEVRDAILLCGLVARSSGHVRTGIGAARQDVNVSVRGGNRCEIKGVMKAGYAVKLVHNEGIRQANLLKLRDRLHERGIKTADDVHMRLADVSDIFADVDLGFVRRTLEAGGKIVAVRIEGVAGLADHPTQPDTTFLDELSGRVRVIACLDQHPIVLSGAFLPDFPRVHYVRERVRKRLKLGPNDQFFLLHGPEEDCRTGAEEIRLRWIDATQGVPKETRQSLIGGLTTFERILPGPDRMYPDTDSPPTRVTQERVAALRAQLAPAPWDRAERFGSWGVPAETTNYLIRRGGAAVVEEVVRQTGVDGLTAAVEIGQRAKGLRRRGVPVDRLGVEQWVRIFHQYTDAKIPREGIPALARALAQQPELDGDTARQAAGFHLQSPAEWRGELDQLTLASLRAGRGAARDVKLRYLVGEGRRMLAGRAPAKEIAELLASRLEEVRA